METLSKEAERKLLECIRAVTGEVGAGATPTEAVTKVAQDARLSPHFTRLVCQAYNTGSTTRQREDHEDVLGKMAEFPLADADTVIDRLYPGGGEKQASLLPNLDDVVDPGYSKPPVPPLRKAARALALPRLELSPLPQYDFRASRAISTAKQAAARELEQARHDVLRLDREFALSLGRAADYFKQGQAQRESFSTVARNVELLFAKTGSDVMDYIRQRNKLRETLEKPAGYGKVDLDKAPYSLVVAVLDRGRELLTAREKLARLRPAPEVAAAVEPFPDAKSAYRTDSLLTDPVKTAEGGFSPTGLLGDTLGGQTRSFIDSGMPKPTNKLKEETWLDLENPEHQNEMRSADTQAMLTDFLANDEVISKHDPAEVMKHFNEISQVTPNAANKALIMRPLLRKALAGGIEPFEAEGIARNEQVMNKTKNVTPNSQGLLDAPQSLLG